MRTAAMRIVFLMICFVMCMCLIPPAFADEEIIASGICGDSITWNLNSNGILSINGTGEMTNYGYPPNCAPWYDNRDYIKEVVLDHGITSLGSFIFYECRNLTNVTVPSSVTSIRDHAFYNCGGLIKIIIPNSVKDIGNGIFYGCSKLTSAGPIDSDSNIEFDWKTEIPKRAFHNSFLADITIPSSISRIGSSAFAFCPELKSITIPSNVTVIGEYAFEGTKLSSAGPIGSNCDIKYGWTSHIPEKAFYGCFGLKKLIISEEITSIGEYICFDCNSLTDVIIPEGVTEIGTGAFIYCDNLTSVILPSSIENIGPYAFYECINLTTAYYCGFADDWSHVSVQSNNELLTDALVYHELRPQEGKTPTCTEIGYEAYWTCDRCKKMYNDEAGATEISAPLVIPALGHSMIGTAEMAPTCTEVGYEAYWTCDRCKKMYSDEAGATEVSAPIVVSALGHSMIGNAEVAPTCTEVGYEAYWTCDRCNKMYSDEAGATEISASIAIPALGHTLSTPVRENEVAPSILNLGHYDEVVYCSVCQAELSREQKPIEKIRSGNCEDNLHWRLSEIESGYFELILSPSDLATAASVSNSAAWSEVRDLITKIVLEKGITDIGDSVFSGYSNLGQVTLPDSLRTIGDNALNNCNSLKSLNLNNGLLSIGSNFIKGTSITEMTIPDSVSNVSDGALTGLENNLYASIGKDGAKAIGNAGYSFRDKQADGFVFRYFGDDLILISGDSYQRTVSVPRGVTHIGENAFQNNTRLSTVTLPGTVKDIGDRAFSNCSRLATIHLPYGLLSIGQYAFDSCVSLSTLNVPYSVTNIGASAFSYCTALTLTVYQGSQTHVYAVHNNIPYTLAYESEAPFGTPDFTLPQRLSEISEEAFMGVPATCIELSSDVNTIQDSAFEDCFQLRQIYIPSSVSYISPSAFNGTTDLVIYGVAGSYAEDYAYDNGFGFIERQ